jgi:methionyl-tRNA synthetase
MSSQPRKILVTYALPYANGSLHLGHITGFVQTDIWVRLQKMLGHECTFVSGTDSHGTPIMIQADKLNLTPEQLVTQIHAEHSADLTDFLIGLDNYYTTHSPENKQLASEIFLAHQANGNIFKKTILQAYDPEKNMFLPDRFIKGDCPQCQAKDQYGDNCEVCGATYGPTDLKNAYSTLSGATPIEKESEHYFFKLTNYEKFLQEWTHNNHLQPEVANKLNEWFTAGLKEWDISRDKPYFGFTIPGAQDKYFYCWLDAPIGYMASFANYCGKNPALNFADYWHKDSTTELYHFIGKDIVYFHALFWPAVLTGADYRTPTAIYTHGFLTVDGQKMSKSRGTFIQARTYLKHLPAEYLRYYLAAKLSQHVEDLDINFEDFSQKINADIIGKFVNIASRCASFISKNFASQLADSLDDTALFNDFSLAGASIAEKFANRDYHHAIRQIMGLADRANQYVDEKKPWAMIKDPSRHAEVHSVCTMGINLFRLLAIYLKPILPQLVKNIETFLQCPAFTWQDKNTPLLNHTILTYQPLAQRIEKTQMENLKNDTATVATPAPTAAPTPADTSVKKHISIDDFNKIDLRIAKVLVAEHVEGADKLLRLELDLGDEQRQVFSGIKSAYEPEQLINKLVVMVANLEPRKMRFGMSDGMVLTAGTGGKDLWVISPETGATPGMKVK